MAALPPSAVPPSSSSRPLAQLPSVLRQSLAQWKSLLYSPPSPSVRAQPFVLVLCASALRCQAVVKALRPLSLPPHASVKAYARHFKVEEQREALQSRDVRIVVGTPHRIRQLLDRGAFHLSRLQLTVVDCAEDGQAPPTAGAEAARAVLPSSACSAQPLTRPPLCCGLLCVAPAVKRYSLLTLPGVKDDLWALYGTHLHPPIEKGQAKLCLH